MIICSCDNTMQFDEKALKKACGDVTFATQACRKELDIFKNLAPNLVTCTQESAIFQEVNPNITLVNIRETAGWSDEASSATAKIIALIKSAEVKMPPVKLHTLESKGVALIYGNDEKAIELGKRLASHVDVTVLLSKPQVVLPPTRTDFPVVKGTITKASGVLGRFELNIDDYAVPLPSSRATLNFAPPRNGATSTCDIIVDVSSGQSLFPAHELRAGYLRGHDIEKLVAEASHLSGTFDKPLYIDFSSELCAHSRSKITGCTKCLDICPTGAMTPNGDSVLIDAGICAGCGACAASCPTGAASYALPSSSAILGKIRVMLMVYKAAGGVKPVILFHDEQGEAQIEMLARLSRGLPAHVLPLRVNEVYSLGLEFFMSSFAWGAAHLVVLNRAKPKHDVSGLHANIGLAGEMLSGLGYGDNLITALENDDPEALRAQLDAITSFSKGINPSEFLPLGQKRNLLELSVKEARRVATLPIDLIALSKGAPFGKVEVDTKACTLCLACVSACPTSALTDNSELPQLRFTESLCVQCGICAKTCPEEAITLTPQVDFTAWNEPKRVLNEEEPFACVECETPFGVKSAILKVQEKLSDHWMFQGNYSHRMRMLQMCDKCRVNATIKDSIDPYGKLPPKPRTAEDYK